MTATATASHVGLVVEGPGDAGALPILLRKYLEQQSVYDDIIGKPVRCNGRDKAIVPKGIEGFVAVAASRPGCRFVLVVLDGEGDPVCELGPALLRRAREVTAVPIAVCLADRTYEDWLYASCETLQLGELQYSATTRGLGAIKNALAYVKYVKPTWQPRLTSRMDISLAKDRSKSLQRMLSKFEQGVTSCMSLGAGG